VPVTSKELSSLREPDCGRVVAPCAPAISAPAQLQLVVVLQVEFRHLPETQLSPVAQSLVALQVRLHCTEPAGVSVAPPVDPELSV
jgi:hypothetical protein